jgi:hypothetical protein
VERPVRRAVAALVLVVAALAASALPGAPAADARPTGPAVEAPIEAQGLDPVLDGVPVRATAALRRADDRLAALVDVRRKALSLVVATAEQRTELAGQAARADQAVAEAEARLTAAHAEDRVARADLARRRLVEEDRRRALAVEQGELRRLAAAAFTSLPADELTFLADWDDVSRSSRRDALRDRTLDEQSARVEAARRPWAAAVARRRGGQRRVGRAVDEIGAAEAARAEAVGLRDRRVAVLAEAQRQVDTAQQALARADAAVRVATLDRRAARLEATVDGTDLPLVALDAYWLAAGRSSCGLPWWVLAGIGRSETRHGTAFGSRPDAAGDTPFTILGVRLDGHPGVSTVLDTDGGLLDHDPQFDRAVGPMQFLPATWARWALDASGDGRADPNNLYDAAAAAGAYLCFRRGPVATDAELTAAVLTYNRALPYASSVLARGRTYRDDLGLPDRPPPPAAPTPPG